MNDNAKKWVAALRSGKYRQGTSFLNADGRLCCLGVACEVALTSAVELHISVDSADYPSRRAVVRYDGERRILPRAVQDWLGLQTSVGSFDSTIGSSLTDMNDNGSTFAVIADFIESDPKGLFHE